MATRAAELRLAALGPAAGPAAVAGPGMAPATLFRVALALLIVGNLGILPLARVDATHSAAVLFNDLVVVGTVTLGLLAAARAGSQRVDGPGLLGLLFAALGAASALLAMPRFGISGSELLFSLAYLVRWLAYFGIYLVAINLLREADVERVWRALETAILAFAAFGILQALFLPGFAQMVEPHVGWDIQGHRLVSTFLDPNMAGALIDIGLLVVLARLSVGASSAWKAVVLLAALALTISRGSIGAFVAGGLVILAARGLSRRLLRIAALLLVLALPFVPALIEFAQTFRKFNLGYSAALKVPFWLHAIRVFLDHPVIGVGFNTYGYVQRSYGWAVHGVQRFGVDGGLLFIGVMTGLVGLALYAGMMVLVLRRCRRIWRDGSRGAQDQGLAIGVAAATVAIVVHSVFANSLIYPLIMEPLWVLWALTFALDRPAAVGARVPGAPVIVTAPRLSRASQAA